MKIERTIGFDKSLKHVKYKGLKMKLFKQIKKIIENPLVGKPMKYKRKGTRELYIPPFRLSYIYEKNKIILLTLYHKDMQ